MFLYKVSYYCHMNTITWDKEQQSWIVTAYSACKTILSHPAALIPAVPEEGLTEQDRAIKQQLVRLSNPPRHAAARQAAEDFFWSRREVDLPALLDRLIGSGTSFDWMEKVCRRLPALYILKSFNISDEESDRIVSILPQLVLLMKGISPGKEWSAKYTQLEGPLIGLLIQSYDATRGLLSNAILQLLQQEKLRLARDGSFCKKFVLEVLRYDSPVLHTRRIAGDHLIIEDQPISKGDLLILMLADANRDAQQFTEPDDFDIERPNNATALSFGYGMHACLASAFCIHLATKVLHYLAGNYPDLHPDHLPMLIRDRHRPQQTRR